MGNTQILETLDDDPDDTTDDVVTEPDDATDPPADDTDPDVDEPDDEDEVLKSLTPEQRARFDEAEARVSKANNNAKKWRLTATGKLPKKPVPGPPKPKAPAKPTDDDDPSGTLAVIEHIRAELRAEAAAERIQGTARSALADAGLVLPTDTTARRKALAKAVKLLDLDGAEDEDDVDIAIAELKREMPALFGKRTRSKPAGGVASGPRSQAPSKAKTKVGKIGELFD